MLQIKKKGIQLNEAFGAVLTLVLLAVLVIVAFVMFSSLNTATAATNTPVTVVNESSFFNSTGDPVNFAGARDFANPTVLIAINGSSGLLIAPPNYSISAAGIVMNATARVWQNVNLTYSYTYTLETAASNASTVTSTNFSGYPALVGLVGTIVFLSLVIGILVAAFVFGGTRGA